MHELQQSGLMIGGSCPGDELIYDHMIFFFVLMVNKCVLSGGLQAFVVLITLARKH